MIVFNFIVVSIVIINCHCWHSPKSNIKRSSFQSRALKMELFEGNPVGKFLWDSVWKLPIMKLGPPGTSPTTFGDNANVIKSNILQLYGGFPSVDGAPIAEGEMGGFLEGSAFLGLFKYYKEVVCICRITLINEFYLWYSSVYISPYVCYSTAAFTSLSLDQSHL